MRCGLRSAVFGEEREAGLQGETGLGAADAGRAGADAGVRATVPLPEVVVNTPLVVVFIFDIVGFSSSILFVNYRYVFICTRQDEEQPVVKWYSL